MKEVFTTGQIAKLCKVAPRTVSKWFDSGRLLGYRIPGSNDRRVPRKNLRRFLVANGMPTDELDEGEFFRVVTVGFSLKDAEKITIDAYEDQVTFDHTTNSFTAGLTIQDREPDCVVIDCSVGRSDAIAIAAKLRDLGDNCPHLVGVANEDETGFEQLGEFFHRVFTKPFNIAKLNEHIEGLAEAKFEPEETAHKDRQK